jgi:hypothetical protein
MLVKAKASAETSHAPTSFRVKRGSALDRWLMKSHPDLGYNQTVTDKLHKLAEVLEARNA